MQAYMKSELPFYGVPMPVVRSTLRSLVSEYPIGTRTGWEATIRALFDDATHREERYAALVVAGHPRFREYQKPASLPLYTHLIVKGSWWDIVDDVSRRVGDVLLGDRAATTQVMQDWSRAADRWLRRSSIICQLGHRAETDTGLLTAVVDRNLADRQFFIRKAIGWALRDYARTAPDWVRGFVASRHDTMSGLSRREALKHLG